MRGVPETRFDEEKQMTLETDASKLTRRLQQVNPDVTLDLAKQLMNADEATKEKVYLVYSLNQTQSWIDDVRGYLNI